MFRFVIGHKAQYVITHTAGLVRTNQPLCICIYMYIYVTIIVNSYGYCCIWALLASIRYGVLLAIT